MNKKKRKLVVVVVLKLLETMFELISLLDCIHSRHTRRKFSSHCLDKRLLFNERTIALMRNRFNHTPPWVYYEKKAITEEQSTTKDKLKSWNFNDNKNLRL